MYDYIEKTKKFLSAILSWVCIILFAFMTLVGTYQIITRYVFNSPSTISEELLTYCFTWLALFAATNVFAHREHMRMGYFADKFPEKVQFCIYIGSEVLVFFFAVIVLLFGGISITKLTFSQITASLGISMGTVYLVVPICGALIAIFSIINIYQICKGREK